MFKVSSNAGMKKYLKDIEKIHASEIKPTEHTYRPALKLLIETLQPSVVATNEPRRVECGAPDFTVSHSRESLIIGYIECKDVGKSLDEAEESDQLKRYFRSLGNLILTDYLEFRWYIDGECRQSVTLAQITKGGKISLIKDGDEAVRSLLNDFLSHSPEPISTPKELAQRMARLTHLIRDIVMEVFNKNRASSLLKDLRKAFAAVLIPDLDKSEKTSEFADMYAQTIAYGLFAARCNHSGPSRFKRLGAANEIPKTNPFLRRLFETITGTDLNEEPYAGFVDDLTQMLSHADIEAILAQFGDRDRQRDPVIHFYETFLSTYDPALREKRGVYYTPESVVSYIVRSIDRILLTEFELPDGLGEASTFEYEQEEKEQWDETRASGPIRTRSTYPRVLVLDPACGTGTFLYSVIDLIREGFMQRGDAGLWSGYVNEHLLPRILGFELLMAPYAIAHFKLGMQMAGMDLSATKRKVWGYDFSGGERLQVYLTNTLEEAEYRVESLFGPLRVISEEANATVKIKRTMPILVVLGNPPYSGHSANRSWEIKEIRGKKKRVPTFIGKLIQDYFQVDGNSLDEKNPKWLQDDYVKFIRWAQWRIEKTGSGILAFITNHGYLDNPTFRGMRQLLIKTFSKIYILDLHGNAKKRERCPDGSKDENVFDIRPGVAIGIFLKAPQKMGPAEVYHAELWGSRKKKEDALFQQDVTSTPWRQIHPTGPFYLLTPENAKVRSEYDEGWKITEVMPINVLGFQTHRDKFAVDFDRQHLHDRIDEMRNEQSTDDNLRERYGLKDNRDWKLSDVRARLRKGEGWEEVLIPCLYRPFDVRFCYFSEIAMDYPRRELKDHVMGRDNMCLLSSRQQAVPGYRHCWVTTLPANDCVVSTTSREANQVFPLYLYSAGENIYKQKFIAWPAGKGGRVPNCSRKFIEVIQKGLGLKFIPDNMGDTKGTFGPEDIFQYMYAILHSPAYRTRYEEPLKRDFPRVPFTTDPHLFYKLSSLGRRLISLHLLESVKGSRCITHYPIEGDNLVDKGYPKYVSAGESQTDSGRVYVNQNQYFEMVPRAAWEFYVGSYQVCHKWLKDRQARKLSYDDLIHYQRIILALNETIRLMEEIDRVIPNWPIQ
jgi:predicted helicase